MFWRKKKIAEAPVETPTVDMAGTTPVGGPSGGAAAATTADVKAAKLPGAKPIPEMIGKYLIGTMGKEAGWVWRLTAVTRPRAGSARAQDIRIFAGYEASSKNIKVKDYTSLDKNPDLLLFEGWFDKDAKKVELTEKRIIPRVEILTEAQIRQKIEEMTEPGSKVHFFLSASPASGGPLGRGAAVVELNPKYPGKGQKKYILSAVSVEGTEPTAKGFKMFDSDKPRDLSRWIKERHQQASGY
jgi:hypothetical protein